MDFTKFVSILYKKSLFFVRVDKLADPFEGFYTQVNATSPEHSPIHITKQFQEQHPDQIREQILKGLGLTKDLRKFYAVSCWSMSDYESAAMWRLYLKSDEGIAIRSTSGRLKKALSYYPEEKLYLGEVRYIDYEKDHIPNGGMIYALSRKE